MREPQSRVGADRRREPSYRQLHRRRVVGVRGGAPHAQDVRLPVVRQAQRLRPLGIRPHADVPADPLAPRDAVPQGEEVPLPEPGVRPQGVLRAPGGACRAVLQGHHGGEVPAGEDPRRGERGEGLADRRIHRHAPQPVDLPQDGARSPPASRRPVRGHEGAHRRLRPQEGPDIRHDANGRRHRLGAGHRGGALRGGRVGAPGRVPQHRRGQSRPRGRVRLGAVRDASRRRAGGGPLPSGQELPGQPVGAAEALQGRAGRGGGGHSARRHHRRPHRRGGGGQGQGDVAGLLPEDIRAPRQGRVRRRDSQEAPLQQVRGGGVREGVAQGRVRGDKGAGRKDRRGQEAQAAPVGPGPRGGPGDGGGPGGGRRRGLGDKPLAVTLCAEGIRHLPEGAAQGKGCPLARRMDRQA